MSQLFATPAVRESIRILFYVILILACVLFAPEEALRFIYTEF